jgi:hypothetical protein
VVQHRHAVRAEAALVAPQIEDERVVGVDLREERVHPRAIGLLIGDAEAGQSQQHGAVGDVHQEGPGWLLGRHGSPHGRRVPRERERTEGVARDARECERLRLPVGQLHVHAIAGAHPAQQVVVAREAALERRPSRALVHPIGQHQRLELGPQRLDGLPVDGDQPRPARQLGAARVHEERLPSKLGQQRQQRERAGHVVLEHGQRHGHVPIAETREHPVESEPHREVVGRVERVQPLRLRLGQRLELRARDVGVGPWMRGLHEAQEPAQVFSGAAGRAGAAACEHRRKHGHEQESGPVTEHQGPL